jgi:YHS domain-containing protein
MMTAALAIVQAEEKKVDPVRRPAVVDLQNAKCPIGGKKIDGKTFTDFQGVRVHFCCPGCDKKFQKDPASGLAKLGLKVTKGAKGKPVVDLANAKCPIMGGTAKDNVVKEIAGVHVHYCCPGCDRKLQQAPAKGLAKLGYRYIPAIVDLQNKSCPISGEPVDGKTFVDHDGIRVQVCCPGCDKKFKRDPAQGYAKLGVDPDRVKATTR